MDYWKNFKKGTWNEEINVEEFIQLNYSEYDEDESFLVGPTDKTKKVWNKCEELLKE